MINVLVLGGGPDAERPVSLNSSKGVADALKKTGAFGVNHQVIDTPGVDALRALQGDVIFPVLHGRWGEGGPLQDLLAADARPFVGAGPMGARLAMDKVATKSIALSIGVHATATAVFDPRDSVCPLPLPVVVKPIHEGSTIGLFICRTQRDWTTAHAATAKSGKPCMIEPFIAGREITVGLIDGSPLPIIEITPASGLYDYEAKYTRNDTRYTPNPPLPYGVAERVASDSVRLAAALGARHIARADFIVDQSGVPWLLEINTMPGFTDHSLVPMAARALPGGGWDMPALCARLVELALRDMPVRTSEQQRARNARRAPAAGARA